jgi:NAD(P)H-dependent flavin oxidoreductase YrpB (nitropropane dioxygenase family)
MPQSSRVRDGLVNDDVPGRDHGLLSLIGVVAEVTGLPQIAAGGIMGPRQVQAVLAAGAVAAQCGTAFLRSPESGAHPLHKAALADPRYTATTVTRAFSGRSARGLVNEFIMDHVSARPTPCCRASIPPGSGHTGRLREVEGYLEKGRHASEGSTVR